MEKKTNKEISAIFKFLRKSALSQGFDKIGCNYVLSAHSNWIFVKNAKK